jgi:molybdate transport system regulatory protein
MGEREELRGAVETSLEVGETTVTERDVELLSAISEHSSIHAASGALGRSYAHAQRRVVELEEVLGPLVERTRGGSGGGGSQLTDEARGLLARFERLETAADGLASVAETVFSGSVIERDGELGIVEGGFGRIRALVPPAGGEDEREAVEVTIRSDAVTLTPPEETPAPDETSARNRFEGVVLNVDPGESVAKVEVDIGTETPLRTLLTRESVERLGLEPGREVVTSFKATATRATPTHPD